MNRRTTLTALAASSASLVLGARASAATSYPNRPVRVVSPYTAGGNTDFITRLITQRLQEELQQTFVVENRPGAGGSIGSNLVAKSPADGYTLLAGSLSTYALNPVVYGNLNHDPRTDLIPVAMTAIVLGVIAVSPALQVKDLRGLVALMRANPGKINYGSAGNGASSHIALAHFLQHTGTRAVHIPYRGISAALVDLLAGNISILFISPSVVREHVQQGRLVALASIAPTRLKVLPDVPTAAESGYPEYDAYSWNCLFAPQGTPQPVCETLCSTVNRILARPDVIDHLENGGMRPVQNQTLASNLQFTRAEFAKSEALVRRLNIKAA